MISSIKLDWYQKNLDFLFLEVGRIRNILEQSISPDKNSSIPVTDYWLDSNLDILCQKFNVSAFERDILLLCLGIEFLPSIGEFCAKLQGNTEKNYPTLSLAISNLPNSSWQVISPTSSLQKWKLIEFTTHLTLTQATISLERRIFYYLLGSTEIDEKLIGIVRPIPERFHTTFLPESQLNLIPSMTEITSNSDSKFEPILQLYGQEMTSKYALAYQTCQKLNRNLFVLSANNLPTKPIQLETLKQRWEREAILSNSVLLLECPEIDRENTPTEKAISSFIDSLNAPLIISSSSRRQSEERPLITFEISPLSSLEQKSLWLDNLGEFSSSLNDHLPRVISQFNLSYNAIESISFSLKNSLKNSENFKDNLPELLCNSCRSFASPKLDNLAKRIETNATWDDLILPKKDKNILKDIAVYLKQKAKVHLEWGFAEREKRGLGMTALFSGVSGTGKTMAAEILANTLNLDLYRIDLSSVVSKYIGETEKNLRKIFDAAETGGAVLLFDEADAIFGKRTEVKDSHDRHANVEISYLLQRMETYQGLAILTTNFKDALDRAFLRRIRFILSFPFPDKECRREIWKRIFPAKTPTSQLNFEKLARLNVTGGSIYNIALNGAILAAEAGEPVMMKHLLEAARKEYQKIERVLTDGEILGWV